MKKVSVRSNKKVYCKKKPILEDLLSADGFSIVYPQADGRLNARDDLQRGMPSLMNLTEITDKSDQTLMYMPPDAAIRQKLFRRMVCVALLSPQKKVHVYKRNEAMMDSQGLWDLYAGPVLMNEAREDAALRLLEAKSGLSGLYITEQVVLSATRHYPLHMTLFTARIAKGGQPALETKDTLLLDADELRDLSAKHQNCLRQSLFGPHKLEKSSLHSIVRACLL